MKPIVDVGLFGFGLANAGVLLTGEAFASEATWTIFLALLVGKTVGITAFAAVASLLGFELPRHMTMKHVVVLGCVAGIGFTVALFVTTVAVGTGEVPVEFAGMLKLGALLSFAAGPAALVLAKIFKIEKIHQADGAPAPGHH